MTKKNILVFPCGSEVALEIHRSLRYSTYFHLVGASSVADHGRFVYQDYIGDVPFHTAPGFVDAITRLVAEKKVDAIYPAMDAVARTLKLNEAALGCRVIGSSKETTVTCASKLATYSTLSDEVPCPRWSSRPDAIEAYPILIKPAEGYGSRGIFLAETPEDACAFAAENSEKRLVFSEWLPGEEYTVDCFSNRHGRLLFAGARIRQRVKNGISVSTVEADKHRNYFKTVAERINDRLQPRGAWFFQMKEDYQGEPRLLEVAARLGGSSSYFRAKGVNFALLSAMDAFDYPVSVYSNAYDLQLNRALKTKYKLSINYATVYVDFDDCVLIDGKVNTALIAFLYQALNRNKRLMLMMRRDGDIDVSLKKLRLHGLFDEIVHLSVGESKAARITSRDAIFIDDSHDERLDVARNCGIPVFAPDMVEALQE